MEKEMLIEKEKAIYTKYQDIICLYIMELEVRDSEYPIEIFNEIRSVFTHLARYKLQDEQNDLISAERHIKRAILDCYKYLCISIAENTAKFREEYKKVDLKLADNGTFLPTLDRLDCLAQEAFKAAKKSEIKKCDDDEQYQLYENAYNAYSAVDKHLVDSNEAILFASSHSKNTNRLTIISCIITIISIIVAIIMAII